MSNKDKKQEKIRKVICVDGGIGRCISATGPIRLLKEKEPNTEIVIITNHPDVFFNNPNVDIVYPLNTPYLWEQIKDHEYIYPEPYNMVEFYRDKWHVIECFSKLLIGERKFVMPEIYLTEQEKDAAQKFIEHMRKETGKELVLFQPHGQSGGMGVDDNSYRSLTYEYAEKLAKAIDKCGYEVIIIKLPEQTGIKGYKTFNGLSGRQIAALIPYVKYCIGIDSFLQHAAAALNVPMTVFWGGTIKENFEYSIHNNIVGSKLPKLIPNRIPHNILNVEKVNFGTNKYSEKYIDEILEKIKNGV
jgi:ADP-heptose:LPS heptosyltransferase